MLPFGLDTPSAGASGYSTNDFHLVVECGGHAGHSTNVFS